MSLNLPGYVEIQQLKARLHAVEADRDTSLTAEELRSLALAAGSQANMHGSEHGKNWSDLCQKALKVAEKFGCYTTPENVTVLWHPDGDVTQPPVPLADRAASLAAPAQEHRWHLLDAPCLWCGYNGAGYFQTGTHSESCPWFNVGGAIERGDKLAYVRYPDTLASSSLAGPGTADEWTMEDVADIVGAIANSPLISDERDKVLCAKVQRLRAAALPAAPSETPGQPT